MNVTLIILALLLGSPADPASTPPAAPAVEQEMQVSQAPSADALLATFTKYQIAIVRKGSAWTKDAPQKIEKLSADRGDYWKSMVEQGKLLGMAQVVDPGDIRGVLFFKINDKDEMKAVASKAPAIKAKLVIADIRTVWGSRGLGATAKESAGTAMQSQTKETYYLIANTKGPKWSTKADSPETRKSANEGMTYLYGLYKGGTLRFFAALEDMSVKLRNILIVKASSADEAMKIAKESPAVKNGWNTANVYEVKVPAGIVP
jgi:hypothetical protein